MLRIEAPRSIGILVPATPDGLATNVTISGIMLSEIPLERAMLVFIVVCPVVRSAGLE